MTETGETEATSRPRKAQRAFRGSVVVIYWIALPFVLLGTGGWVSSLFLVPGSPRNWMMAGGSLVFSALLIWRLWLNSRAIGRAGRFPSRQRFWRVFAPLGLLGFMGLCLAGMGAGCALVAATALQEAAPDAVPLAIGAAAVLFVSGGMMCVPIMRLLLRRPVTDDASPEA